LGSGGVYVEIRHVIGVIFVFLLVGLLAHMSGEKEYANNLSILAFALALIFGLLSLMGGKIGSARVRFGF